VQSGAMTRGREVWKFSAIIEATAADAERVSEAIARALCPEEWHSGPCEVPWTLIQCRFEDLDDDERALWQDDFDNDRSQRPPASGDAVEFGSGACDQTE